MPNHRGWRHSTVPLPQQQRQRGHGALVRNACWFACAATGVHNCLFSRIIDGRLRSDRQRQQLFDTGMVALLECILGLFDRGREATGTHSWEPRYHIQSKECVIGGLSLSLGRRRSRSHCFSWAEWNKAASMLLETCSQLRDLVVAVW